MRKFYSYIFVDGYFDGLFSENKNPSTYWHGVAVFIMRLWASLFILLLVTLGASSFFIQISVIYDVATKPALSQYLNLFVLVYAIASILFSWLVLVIQLPLPEIDLSNYLRLSEIEKEYPDRYRKLMQKIAERKSKKEAFSMMAASAIIYMLLFTAISVFWFSGVIDDLAIFIGKGMPGVVVVLFLSNEIMRFIRKRVLIWFFRNHPNGEPTTLQVFGRVKKMLLITQMVVSAILSTAYTFYALSPDT